MQWLKYPVSIVVGAIWGGLVTLVAVLIIILVGGQKAAMTLGIGGLAGAGAALTIALLQTREQSQRIKMLSGTAAGVLLFLLFSAGTPFGLDVSAAPAWSYGGCLAVGAIVSWAIVQTLTGIDLNNMRRYQAEELILRCLRGLGLAMFSILVALPFYAMLVTSLKTQAEMLANPLDYRIDLTQGFSNLFSSYVELFEVFNFGRYILISSLVSVVTVVLTLAAAVPGAYAVARLRFPGRAVLSRSILLIYMVPAIVLVIPLYSVFSQLGLRDSLLGLLIVYPATTIPVALYMLQGYFRGLPSELEEAGLMDNLGRFGVILRITLPLSLPALMSVSL
ncbi:MAG: carbohydrate ABC transporter permease, partial [Rhodospirillales bacterium]|nr:carbohydrate ABC transporter permease [Rhodospirillales bacterium]